MEVGAAQELVMAPEAMPKERAELLADLTMMRGELLRKEKENKALATKIKRLRWELNLHQPEGKWKISRARWPHVPTLEIIADVVGVPRHIFEQNELMKESHQSDVAGRAMISGEIRQVGETMTEAVTRLGAMGLSKKRKELRESAKLEWQNLVPKSYGEVKEEVMQIAREEDRHYHFRAERISARARERFQPACWYQWDLGCYEEDEAEVENRIRAAREGSFQKDVTQFDNDKMG